LRSLVQAQPKRALPPRADNPFHRKYLPLNEEALILVRSELSLSAISMATRRARSAIFRDRRFTP
jgi:hypothetical protein